MQGHGRLGSCLTDRWRSALAASLLCGLAAVATAGGVEAGGELCITIAGVRSSNGALLIALYDSASTFENAIARSSHLSQLSDEERFVGMAVRARAGSHDLGCLRLPPGRYGIIAFHDENGDGRLAKDYFGLPLEGYGFGNNASGFLGPPSYSAAAVEVTSGRRVTMIALSY